MARVELPPSRVRARKRARRRRVLLVLGAFVAMCVGAAAGLAHLPALQVRTVAVRGAETLSSSTVAAFVWEYLEGSTAVVFPKRNIFLYPKRAIRDGLLTAYPLLSAVDVHAEDFHTIAVQVVEREPRALWCPAEGGCYFMDETGAVYAPAPHFSNPVYVSYFGALAGERLPKQFLQPESFGALSALVDAIARELSGEELSGVEVDSHADVRMRFASGFYLLFALDDQPGDIFERLTLARTAEPLSARPLTDFLYLDLRFGDKLYYKLRSE